MKDIQHIVVFDFDKTLIYTAEREEGEKLYKQATGKDWAHRGWWSRKETLDIDIFYPVKNEWIYKKYLEAKATPNTIVILMTGRITPLEDAVMKILNHHNFEFDRVFCCDPKMGGGHPLGATYGFKLKKFESFLREFPYADLTMYDDRTEHVHEFQKWARTTGRKIEIVHVK